MYKNLNLICSFSSLSYTASFKSIHQTVTKIQSGVSDSPIHDKYSVVSLNVNIHGIFNASFVLNNDYLGPRAAVHVSIF